MKKVNIRTVRKDLKLNNLINALDNVEDINCGGCGYSVYVLYKYIKKNYNINVKIIMGNSIHNKRIYDRYRKIADYKEVGSHYYLKIGKTYIDSNGFQFRDTNCQFKAKLYEFQLEISLSHLEKLLILPYGHWNPTFEGHDEVANIASEYEIEIQHLINIMNEAY